MNDRQPLVIRLAAPRGFCAGVDRAIQIVEEALETFRLAAREKEEAEARADAERRGFDAERQRNEAESARVSENQRNAMDVVGSALGRLAQGDLAVRIDDIGEEFRALRDDFNSAVESLADTMSSISDTTPKVADSSSELSSAADTLSRRTESQAASLRRSSPISYKESLPSFCPLS